jgi:hypothetical protein
VNVYDSGAFSDYHALQLEVRRRLSKGLQVNGSYQYALEGGSSFLGFHFGRVMNPANASVRHAIKTQWNWNLPVGRGERFSANAHPILSVPQGRYFAPANSADCIQLETGDCAPRTVMLRAPFFTRFVEINRHMNIGRMAEPSTPQRVSSPGVQNGTESARRHRHND